VPRGFSIVEVPESETGKNTNKYLGCAQKSGELGRDWPKLHVCNAKYAAEEPITRQSKTPSLGSGVKNTSNGLSFSPFETKEIPYHKNCGNSLSSDMLSPGQ